MIDRIFIIGDSFCDGVMHPKSYNLPYKDMHWVNYLDYYSENVVNSAKWRDGTDEERRYLVSRVLSVSKKQAMKTLRLHGKTGDRRMEIMYDISKRGGSISKRELADGMEALGMKGEVEDLSNEALELLYFYLKDENNRKKLLQQQSNL